MSTTIDQRIVQMQFDNRQFDSRVQGTVSSIDKLNKSLEFPGASKGFEGISAAARGVNINSIGEAVEGVRLKFSALEVMAITALGNITNTVINAGKNLVSAFTIDPIKEGFSEYETKINSIQTIMSNTASKGTTMSDVTKSIDELNTYADKTIYNFAEMTRNIGTFTAAGVALEPATKAIQGIANLAAASGSNSQQASTAMYQLSQAMATGTVKLMDWNSVVNAGMGGEKFQEALKVTARQHGVAVDDMVAQNGSFRDSLQEGWLSADILNETLNNFTVDGAKKYTEAMVASGQMTQEQADAMNKEAQAMEDAATKVKTFSQLMSTLKEAAQSGWGKSWEIIIGDFEEAKTLFTDVSNVIGGLIGASADARNNLLTTWKTLGGRTEVLDAIRNAFDAVMIVVNGVSEAFRTIFPPMTAEQLVAFSTGLKELTAKLKLSDENVVKLKNVFLGLFDTIQSVGEIVGFFWGKLSPGISILGKIAQFVLDVASAFGVFLTELDEVARGTSDFKESFGVFASTLYTSVETVVKAIFGVGEKTDKALAGVGKAFEKTADVVDAVADKVISFKKNMDDSKPQKFIDGVEQSDTKTKKLVTTLKRVTSSMKETKEETDNASGSLSKMKKVVGENTEVSEQYLQTVDKIKEVFGKFKEVMTQAFGEFDVNTLVTIMGIGVLGVLTFILKKFTEVIKSPIDVFNDMIGSITKIFQRVEKIGSDISDVLTTAKDTLKAYQNEINAKVLMSIAIAVAILAGALFLLSTIEVKKLATAMGAVVVMMASLMGAMALFKKWGTFDKEILVAIPVMLAMSIAIAILAAALKNISTLSWEELAVGLLGIAGLMAMVVGTVEMLSKDTGDLLAATSGLMLFALSIDILAKALVRVGQLEPEQVAVGLLAIVTLLGAIAAFVAMSDPSKDLVPTAFALIAIATAMKKMISAIEQASKLSWWEIARGLTAVGGGLLILVATMNLMPTEQLMRTGVSFAIAAAGLWLIGQALKTFSTMTWEEVIIGITAMGGSLLILAAGLNLMIDTLPGSAALLVAAAALALLAPTIVTFGKMAPEEIVKGFLVIAGVFLIFAGAAALLTPLLPAMAILAGVLLLMGIGIAGLGAGLFLVGAGFELLIAGLLLLSGISKEAAQSIMDSLYIIVNGLVLLIPTVAKNLATGLIEFARVIVEGAPVIAEAVMTIFANLLMLLTTMVPQLVDFFFQFLVKVCEAIATYVPIIAEAAWRLILGLLDVFKNNVPKLIQAGVDIISAFIIGIGEAIPQLVDAAMKSVIAFINGLAEAIRENTPLMIEAINNLFNAIMEAGMAIIENAIPGFGKKGNDLMNNGLVKGIGDFVGGIWSSIKGGLDGALGGIAEFIDKFWQVGSDIINGFIGGIKTGVEYVQTEAAKVAQAAIDASKGTLDENSPSKEFDEIGFFADKGMANGFARGTKLVTSAAKKVSEKAIDVTSKTLASMGNVLMNNIDSEPTIKPVMDLTSIQNGSKMMSNLFGDKSMKLATTAQATTSPSSVLDIIDNVVSSTVGSLMAALANDETSDTTVSIEIPLSLDGREVAKVTAPYTLKEINKINKLKSNLGGIS